MDNTEEAKAKDGKWSKKPPTRQGWFWYRASNHHHAVPTFIEDCGDGKFRAVEIYDNNMVYLTDIGISTISVEWWSEKIYQPE